jgi:hypothetical protein
MQFFQGCVRLDKTTTPDAHIHQATFITLEFTTQHHQKKGVPRGEVLIGLGLSGNPHFCPVLAAARRFLHVRHAGAQGTQPIASYRHAASSQLLTRISPADDITNLLRSAVHILGPRARFSY